MVMWGCSKASAGGQRRQGSDTVRLSSRSMCLGTWISVQKAGPKPGTLLTVQHFKWQTRVSQDLTRAAWSSHAVRQELHRTCGRGCWLELVDKQVSPQATGGPGAMSPRESVKSILEFCRGAQAGTQPFIYDLPAEKHICRTCPICTRTHPHAHAHTHLRHPRVCRTWCR